MKINEIIQGDCVAALKELPDNSVDSVVTDPPYELGFMGKGWDSTGIANNVDMWKECLRVLKPGGHLLSFGGTKTYHRMACAIEDAGFEVRDMIEWVYGSGFPKSLNIAKSLDKMEGVEHPKNTPISDNGSMSGANYTRNKMDVQSDLAKQYEGWGTALKPAHEPICLARKPLGEKSVAENVLKWKTGGINIDESRVKIEPGDEPHGGYGDEVIGFGPFDNKGGVKWKESPTAHLGRFPANLILSPDPEVLECFPETKATKPHEGDGGKLDTQNMGWGFKRMPCDLSDNGGSASRFFKSIIYTAKASKSERNMGCEGLEIKQGGSYEFRQDGSLDGKIPSKQNNHPTVKPIALMEYLIKMITPKGGIVLDPFAGSGSTLIAAKMNGYNYIGIEKEAEYVKIAEARLKAVAPTLF